MNLAGSGSGIGVRVSSSSGEGSDHENSPPQRLGDVVGAATVPERIPSGGKQPMTAPTKKKIPALVFRNAQAVFNCCQDNAFREGYFKGYSWPLVVLENLQVGSVSSPHKTKKAEPGDLSELNVLLWKPVQGQAPTTAYEMVSAIMRSNPRFSEAAPNETVDIKIYYSCAQNKYQWKWRESRTKQEGSHWEGDWNQLTCSNIQSVVPCPSSGYAPGGPPSQPQPNHRTEQARKTAAEENRIRDASNASRYAADKNPSSGPNFDNAFGDARSRRNKSFFTRFLPSRLNKGVNKSPQAVQSGRTSATGRPSIADDV